MQIQHVGTIGCEEATVVVVSGPLHIDQGEVLAMQLLKTT